MLFQSYKQAEKSEQKLASVQTADCGRRDDCVSADEEREGGSEEEWVRWEADQRGTEGGGSTRS